MKQVVVPPFNPGPPGIPGGPLARSLYNANQAIVRANAAGLQNASGALQAQYYFLQAQLKAAAGDMAGALAAAALAQSAANSSGAGNTTLRPALSTIPQLPAGAFPGPSDYAPTDTVPNARPIPLADDLLPADLLVARNEIELAENMHAGADLAKAKLRYRSALNAYLSGNAARARADARASFDAAADIISRTK